MKIRMEVSWIRFGGLSVKDRWGAFFFQLQLWRSLVYGCLTEWNSQYNAREEN